MPNLGQSFRIQYAKPGKNPTTTDGAWLQCVAWHGTLAHVWYGKILANVPGPLLLALMNEWPNERAKNLKHQHFVDIDGTKHITAWFEELALH